MLQPAPDDASLPIDALLARVEHLTHQELASEEFHARLLHDVVASLAAAGGMIWVRAEDGQFRADCQIQPTLLQLEDDPVLRRMHAVVLEGLAVRPETRVLPPDSHDGVIENPTNYELCFQPLVVELRYTAIAELFFATGQQPSDTEGLREVLLAISRAAHTYYLRARLREERARNDLLLQRVRLLAAIQREAELHAWARQLVSEVQGAWNADRTGLLALHGRKCRALAISGVDTIERRSESIRRLERLADAVRVSGPLYPTTDPTQLAPELERLITAYTEESGVSALCLLPLVARQSDEEDEGPDPSEACGVLLLEWYGGTPDGALEQHTAPLVPHIARRLGDLAELERLPLLPLARLLRSMGWQRGSRLRTATLAALFVMVAGALLALIPAELTVTAPGRIEPVVRADVFAPAEGILVDLPAEQLEHVERDQVLAELRSPELDRKWNEVRGQLQTTEQSLAAARAARLQLGRGGENTATDGFATQEIELIAIRDGLLKQLELLEREQQALIVRSPLDGRIVTWDLRQLRSRPVRHGDRLMRIVDPTGPWQLRLAIPESRAGHVLSLVQEDRPLRVTYMLEAAPAATYEGELSKVAEVASLNADGEPILEARVAIERPHSEALRPDSVVSARIHCGQRSLGYVWFHRLVEAFLLRFF